MLKSHLCSQTKRPSDIFVMYGVNQLMAMEDNALLQLRDEKNTEQATQQSTNTAVEKQAEKYVNV